MMQKYMINIFRQFNLRQALRKVSSFPPICEHLQKDLYDPHNTV